MFQRFKEMSIVEIVRASKTQKRKSTLIERTDIENRKIVYCLVGRVFIPHHDELTDFQNKKINDWLSLSLIHDHSRRLTMRQVKIECDHRLQRRNLFILADSRSFSLTHVVSWRFVLLLHSWRRHASWSLSREFSFRWPEDALCKFFIQLTKVRSVASWSLSKRTSHFDDLILLTRVPRRATCFDKAFGECQLVSQNSEREILLC